MSSGPASLGRIDAAWRAGQERVELEPGALGRADVKALVRRARQRGLALGVSELGRVFGGRASALVERANLRAATVRVEEELDLAGLQELLAVPGVHVVARASEEMRAAVEAVVAGRCEVEVLAAKRSLRGVPLDGGGVLEEHARVDVGPRYPDTLLLTLIVPGCELNCVFCQTPQGEVGIAPSTLARVREALRERAGQATGVYFTGGEPSGLPWLVAAIREARDLGYARVQLQTHAGRASDGAVADAWVEAGLTAVDVPIYGADAATHEAVTHTPGSFERTVAGLLALKARGVRTVVHATLFRSNLGGVEALLGFWEGLGVDAAYLQVAGEVGPPGLWAKLAPSPAEVGRAVVAALPASPRAVWLADVPPCLVPGHEARVLRWRGTPEEGAEAMVLPYGDWLMTFTGGRTKRKGAVCGACALKERCDGLPAEMLERFGEGVLRPVVDAG